jgi:hypothetical protein
MLPVLLRAVPLCMSFLAGAVRCAGTVTLNVPSSDTALHVLHAGYDGVAFVETAARSDRGDGCPEDPATGGPVPSQSEACTLITVLRESVDSDGLHSFCNNVSPVPHSVLVMASLNMCTLEYGINNLQVCCQAYSNLVADSMVESVEFDSTVAVKAVSAR